MYFFTNLSAVTFLDSFVLISRDTPGALSISILLLNIEQIHVSPPTSECLPRTLTPRTLRHGDVVNTAARLMANKANEGILVCETTMRTCASRVVFSPDVKQLKLKGKEDLIDAYVPLRMRSKRRGMEPHHFTNSRRASLDEGARHAGWSSHMEGRHTGRFSIDGGGGSGTLGRLDELRRWSRTTKEFGEEIDSSRGGARLKLKNGHGQVHEREHEEHKERGRKGNAGGVSRMSDGRGGAGTRSSYGLADLPEGKGGSGRTLMGSPALDPSSVTLAGVVDDGGGERIDDGQSSVPAERTRHGNSVIGSREGGGEGENLSSTGGDPTEGGDGIKRRSVDGRGREQDVTSTSTSMWPCHNSENGEKSGDDKRMKTVFVGRDAERAMMCGTIEAVAATGDGHVIVVEGESGIGKTTLVNEVIKTVKESSLSVRVLSISADSIEWHTPYAVLRGLVRQLLEVDKMRCYVPDVDRRRSTSSSSSLDFTYNPAEGGGGVGGVERAVRAGGARGADESWSAELMDKLVEILGNSNADTSSHPGGGGKVLPSGRTMQQIRSISRWGPEMIDPGFFLSVFYYYCILYECCICKILASAVLPLRTLHPGRDLSCPPLGRL